MAGSGATKATLVSEGWRQILAGGGLVFVVAAVLVLAAILETSEAPARSEAPPLASAPVAHTTNSGWQPVAAPLTAVPLDGPPPTNDEPVLDSLSRHILDDPARIRRTGDAYTAQIAFACRRETAERMLERSAGSTSLFILPEVRNGEDCFRVCWGSYAGREEALRVPGLPAGLRDGLGKPDAKRIAELVP